jgi:hypothetical protein
MTKPPDSMEISDFEILVIEEFVRRVNARAERTIASTKRVSGAHRNAMLEELRLLKEKRM